MDVTMEVTINLTKNVSKITDYVEPMWFLGTDILTNKDRDLMDKKVGTSFEREYGAIYYIGTDKEVYEDSLSKYIQHGYTPLFISIVREAIKRKYVWIFFDCDITTEFHD